MDQFETLFIYKISDLIDAGFQVVPTYRSPHVTITFYDEPDVVVPAPCGRPPSPRQSRLPEGRTSMKVDLFVDLNTENETGLPWTYVDQADDPSSIIAGRIVRVGSGNVSCLAEVVDVSRDGIVHVRPLRTRSDDAHLAESAAN